MKKKIILTEDQLNLLYCGLRFLELNHPTDDATKFPHQDYRKLFHELLNNLIAQKDQTELFNGAD